MTKAICLEVNGRLEGFRFLWAMYVNGFRPDRVCQPCLRGRRVPEFHGESHLFNRMDSYPFLYICGVSAGPKKDREWKNLHFPLRYAEGRRATATTWSGAVLTAHDAESLPIPVHASNRCRNYQFGMAYFGAENHV